MRKQTPAQQRRQEIFKNVYERCGAKTHDKLVKRISNFDSSKMDNDELGQIRHISELNSSRVNPNFAEFSECMDTQLNNKVNETLMMPQNVKSVKVENQQAKGHIWVKNNEFFSEMLELDPSRT